MDAYTINRTQQSAGSAVNNNTLPGVANGVCATTGKVKAYSRLLLDDELGGLSLSRGVGESFSKCIVGFAKEARPKRSRRMNESRTPLL